MPSLQFKGKNIIWNHHQSPLLPTHTLDLNKELSYNPKNANGNCIVEGDNLLALKALLPEYQGKVDCIYIDPPYNTGNEGWVYNDKVNSPMINEWIGQTVGKEAEDFTRHDKWLCMMTPRLKLLHEMLSDKGVIFVSIDDNEVANLKLLLNEIFQEENFVGEIIVVRSEGGGMAKQLVIGHEYVLVYSKNISNFSPLRKDKDVRGKIVNIEGEDYVIEEDWLRKEFGKYGTILYDEIEQVKGLIKKQEIDDGIKSGLYVLLDKPQGQIVGRYKKLSDESSKFYSILKHLNKNGKADLTEIGLQDFFDYPKPKSLVKELIYGATFKNKNAIVMDSFAGSGTTAQAVLELNKEDGGNRKFLLVQMPEEIKPETPAGKYCVDNNLPLKISSITRERVRLAIKKKINPVVVDKGELQGLEIERQEIGFEYYNLGTPLDSWSIISSQSSAELPSFGKLASYIWKNLTGEKREFEIVKSDSVNKFHLGDYKGEKVFLLYEQDLPKLNGRELCMSLPIAKELEELYPNTPKLIYSPTCYLDDWHREKYQIRYINYPFGM
jgi:adenine-specific DNA-methyltransferase